jgi:predicted secreted protein
MTNFIYITGVFSLIIQILTGIFNYYVLKLQVPKSFELLRKLLQLEFIVQMIEGIFYIWMVYNFSKIDNITHFRYYDWFITTPTMLFTYSFYLLYLKYKEENKEINDNIFKLIQENLKILLPVFILNSTMLLFGYLGEIDIMSTQMAAFFGFIPFISMFYIIYKNYALFSQTGINSFWYFSGIWSLYGVSSVLPYSIKNVIYNILDLFAKNFFGIFLAFELFYANKKN